MGENSKIPRKSKIDKATWEKHGGNQYMNIIENNSSNNTTYESSYYNSYDTTHSTVADDNSIIIINTSYDSIYDNCYAT